MIYWIMCGVGVTATLAAIFYGLYCVINFSINKDEEERKTEL
jgi:hypothetical protein